MSIWFKKISNRKESSKPSGLAIASMVLGIVGLFFVFVIVRPIIFELIILFICVVLMEDRISAHCAQTLIVPENLVSLNVLSGSFPLH